MDGLGEESPFFITIFSDIPVGLYGGSPMADAQAAQGMPITNTPGITEVLHRELLLTHY